MVKVELYRWEGEIDEGVPIQGIVLAVHTKPPRLLLMMMGCGIDYKKRLIRLKEEQEVDADLIERALYKIFKLYSVEYIYPPAEMDVSEEEAEEILEGLRAWMKYLP